MKTLIKASVVIITIFSSLNLSYGGENKGKIRNNTFHEIKKALWIEGVIRKEIKRHNSKETVAMPEELSVGLLKDQTQQK